MFNLLSMTYFGFISYDMFIQVDYFLIEFATYIFKYLHLVFYRMCYGLYIFLIKFLFKVKMKRNMKKEHYQSNVSLVMIHISCIAAT